MSDDVKFFANQDELMQPMDEMTTEQVEDEVIEAVAEVEQEVQVEVEKPNMDEVKKELDEILPKTNTSLPEEKIFVPKLTRKQLQHLRLRDRAFNKTCAECGTRVSLEKIGGGKMETCDDCRG